MKVLVVDDSKLARSCISRSLREAGYETAEAESGKEALEVLSQQNFDMITMDIQMPDLDGYETTRLIREREEHGTEEMLAERKVPVVFVTSIDDLAGRMKGYELGCSDVILKGINVQYDVVDAVNKQLRPKMLFMGARALIVDHHKSQRFILENCLRGLGVVTESVHSGIEGCITK